MKNWIQENDDQGQSGSGAIDARKSNWGNERQAQAPNTQSHTTERRDTTKLCGLSREDTRLREALWDEIQQTRAIDASNVEIKVEDGVVSLAGTVPELHMCRAIFDIAAAMQATKRVDNNLRVAKNVRH